MLVVVLYVTALAVPLFVLDFLEVPLLVLFAACLLGVVAIPFFFARLCRFERAPDEEVAKS